MINFELRHDKGMLVLHPEGPLEAADFILIASQVDTYLAGNGKLHGVLIHANSFPGWKDFAAMLAHLKFLKEHIRKIEKVAVVADGFFANIMPDIANHFVHAQVRHFDFKREDTAWEWINQTDNAQMSPVV
jgi:tRNA U38,U39,U40 pseudouridine synthase TruA